MNEIGTTLITITSLDGTFRIEGKFNSNIMPGFFLEDGFLNFYMHEWEARKGDIDIGTRVRLEIKGKDYFAVLASVQKVPIYNQFFIQMGFEGIM